MNKRGVFMQHLSKWVTALSVSTLLTGALATGFTVSAHVKPMVDRATSHKPTSTSAQLANIAYAGSLQLVNDQVIAPAFTKTTGIQYQGRGGGALGVAHLIASGEITPSVFESIGTAPYEMMGKKTPKWAIGFASSPLVVAYSPNSPYASQLNAIASGKAPLKELFSLMKQPKFHLGRTNPDTDPQGQAFILMMQLAQKQLKLPAGTASKILGSDTNSRQIFAEEAILSRLQSGQLDATSAFLPEAIQHHLPYIALPAKMNMGNPTYKSIYASVHIQVNGKIVKGSPIEIYLATVPGNSGQVAGEKFISFVLSKQGRQIYKQNGYDLTKIQFWGNKAMIPSLIKSQLQG